MESSHYLLGLTAWGVYCGPEKGEDLLMPGEQSPASVERALAAKIVGAYVRRNQIAPDQLASLLHRA